MYTVLNNLLYECEDVMEFLEYLKKNLVGAVPCRCSDNDMNATDCIFLCLLKVKTSCVS